MAHGIDSTAVHVQFEYGSLAYIKIYRIPRVMRNDVTRSMLLPLCKAALFICK